MTPPFHGSCPRGLVLVLMTALGPTLACDRATGPDVVVVPADAAMLFVSVRVVEDGRVVLDRAGTVRLGQPVEMAATRGQDDAPLSVSLWVQHYAALPDAFSVRVTLRAGHEVLFAPVLTARPAEPSRFEAAVDDRTLALELTVDLAERAVEAR